MEHYYTSLGIAHGGTVPFGVYQGVRGVYTLGGFRLSPKTALLTVSYNLLKKEVFDGLLENLLY